MNKIRILLVEDELIVAKDLETRLQILNYEVIGIVNTGPMAIEKAGKTHPDLIIMDILLKGDMDGIEAAEEIRQLFDIPVVYLTAYSDDKTLQRAKISEPYGYILKPFEERELLTCIEMGLYRFRMERKLKESEQWFSTTLRSIGDAVIATDVNGRIKIMNIVAEQLTGWNKDAAIGKDFNVVFNIIDAQSREKVINSITSVDTIFDLSNHRLNNRLLITKKWKEIPIEAGVSPIKDDKGIISGVVLIFRDITERKNAEDKLRITLKQLAELNQNLDNKIQEEVKKNRKKDQILIQQSRLAAMGEMIGNIAHQWRQPLNGMGIIIQNIMNAYEHGDLNEVYLKEAVTNSLTVLKHMSQTIDDFRNFFRPNKEKEEFSLNNEINKTLSLIETSFKEHSISINFISDKEVIRMGYPNEYNQVLLNIISNAKDTFLERHIENPILSIQLIEKGKRGIVRIRDNAGGIPENIIDKIFDPYFTTKENGTGIGLYMSKMIIEKNMKGRLSVRNMHDGAEFEIEI